MARQRFSNLDGSAEIKSFGEVLRWKLGLHEETQVKTPARGVLVPTVQNDGRRLSPATLDALTWIGHASFLVQLGGTGALIDPVMSQGLGPGFLRNVDCGLSWTALPKIDLVLITHNHRDHMDEPTLRKLGKDVIFVVPRGLGTWFTKRKLHRVVELDWWQQEEVAGMKITFVPSQHWTRRGLLDTNASWWGGYVIERGGLRVYHSGDTAWFEGFSEIAKRVGPIDAAMLPIGAYAPRWFMKGQHMNPEDAVRAFQALGAKQFIAMHWGTFKLTDEPLDEPPKFLKQVWAQTDLAEKRRTILAIGETFELDQL
jgi:L-ascorbate metabolism protein UlaG (beta-lactamase superfamily)